MDEVGLISLRWHWRGCISRIATVHAGIETTLADVERRYGEASRHYHTLDHIWHMLQFLQVSVPPVVDRSALDPAVFLHDVIYDSRAKDNEERSAEYAHEVLAELGVSRPIRDEVARLILLTRTHETTEDDQIGQYLLDADLAILGMDEARYDAYAVAIRREYDWVSDADYRIGRRKVLESFLARPRIYYNRQVREEFDGRARANIQREIAALG